MTSSIIGATPIYLRHAATIAICACLAPMGTAWASPDAAQPRTADQGQRAMQIAGGSVNSFADLPTAISSACDVQPWQFAVRKSGQTGVVVQNSPTMTVGKQRCVFAVIASSKFYVANPKDRP